MDPVQSTVVFVGFLFGLHGSVGMHTAPFQKFDPLPQTKGPNMPFSLALLAHNTLF